MGISPLRVTSVREACVRFLEQKILSGEWEIGARLPSERYLASSLEVSRLILHEAIVELAAKGLVEIIPRRGIFIADFRRDGAVGLLSSLMNFQNGELDPHFISSLVDMRLLLETETARLAALNRDEDHIRELETILALESAAPVEDHETLTQLDFSLHQAIAIASGNLMYPMIINSFKRVYTRLTGKFFQHYSGSGVISELLNHHRGLVGAIKDKDSQNSETIMRRMLTGGADLLRKALGSNHQMEGNNDS
jgi:DNA-binding FadR family transcriptional regulator